jgi:hypothetical protein
VLVGCWRDAARAFAVLFVTIEILLEAFDRDGVTWGEAGEDVALWAVVGAAWAVMTWLLLRRRARTAGILLTPDVLAGRQTRQLRALRPSVGWSDRMRTELKASDRASVAAEKGREEIWFHWRPGRRKRTVWGSITFDEPSGTVRLDLRDGAAYTGGGELRRGAAFVALCQLARELGLVEAEGRWRGGDPVKGRAAQVRDRQREGG